MADLEQLAIKRDRGYLVRLVLLLCIGVCVSVFLWKNLTGDHVSGCLANAFLGQDSAGAVKPGPAPAGK